MTATLIAAAAFTFLSPQRAGRVFVADGEPEFVHLAAEDLASDVKRITGRRPSVSGGAGAAPGDIAIATRPDGRREACDASVEDGVLWLTGSDPHGTMACVYSFIENRLGVDPLSFWNGVPYPKRDVLSWDDVGFHEPPPRFTFRGAFINDEDFLLHWRTPEGSRPVLTSRVVGGSILNHGTMAQVAETLVRMRFNTIIPGSYLDPTDPADAANLEICARRGLYLSQHHHDPLGLSGFMFLNSEEAKARNLKYSYVANPREIEAGWRRAAAAYARFPNVIWQIGLRGISDAPAWKDDPSAPRDDAARAVLIARAMKRQMEILDEVGVPRENRHVTATLWGEGSYFMSKGMLEVPEGTTVVYSDNSSGWWWPDDFSAVRPDSNASRGVYYHLNLLTAGPHHVPAIPVALQYARLREAVAKGATDMIMVNVGNIREFVYNLDAIRRICHNPDSFDVAEWERNWCAARFPVRTGEAQTALERYFAAPARHPVHGHPMLLDGHVYFNLWGHRLFGMLDRTLADMRLGRKTAPRPSGRWQSNHDDPFAKALFDANLPALGPWEEVLAIAERQRDEYARLVLTAVDLEKAQPQEYRSRAFTALTYPVKIMHAFSAFAAGCARAAMACEKGDRAALAVALEEAVAGFEGYDELSARYQEGRWANWLRGGRTVDIPEMVGWARHFLKIARNEEYADDGEFSLYCPADGSDPRFAPDSLVVRIMASRPVSGMRVVPTDGGRLLLDERLKSPTTACLREVPHASGRQCVLKIDFAEGGTRTVPEEAKLKILYFDHKTGALPAVVAVRHAEGGRGVRPASGGQGAPLAHGRLLHGDGRRVARD